MMKKILAIAITGVSMLVIFVKCNDDDKKTVDPTVIPVPTPVIPCSIIAAYPHDTSAYTQGLEFYKGKLYEGTGDYSESSLRITDIKTGKVEKKYMMGTDSIFGEGITIFKDRIYQLTWESNIVYVYDVNNITKPIKTIKWPYPGWGITNNGTDLIISDGTANLYFVNPDDFKLKTTISVTEKESPVMYLNELEFIDGFVYANVYMTDFIIKIDPSSGHVIAKMDFPGLKEKYFAGQVTPRTDYFNGIAYDTATKTMYITGKRWPKLFEVKMN
jgi:glutaminyl-peptide cyclotransferase